VEGDGIFCEMIRRLCKDALTKDDFDYIEDEKTAWEEAARWEQGFYESGRKEGIKEGEKDKAIEMAKNSLKEGLSIESISKLTGLPKEEIEKLK
jgi:predicted transposase/invertase (TIGR01784 family)